MRLRSLKIFLVLALALKMMLLPAFAQLEDFTESGGYWVAYIEHLNAIYGKFENLTKNRSDIADAQRECESAKSDLERIRPILDRAHDRLEPFQQGILGPIRQNIDSVFDELVDFESAHDAMCDYYESKLNNYSAENTDALELRSTILLVNSTAAPIEKELKDLRTQLLEAGDLLDREGQYLNRAVSPLSKVTENEFADFFEKSAALVEAAGKLDYPAANDTADGVEDLIEKIIDNMQNGAGYLDSATLFEEFLQTVRKAHKTAERVEDEMEDLTDALGSSSSSRDDYVKSAARDFNSVRQSLAVDVAQVAEVMSNTIEFHNDQFAALEDVCDSCD